MIVLLMLFIKSAEQMIYSAAKLCTVGAAAEQ